MTFTATGEPSNQPPRVHLELDTAVSGATFNTLTVSRDGTPIRLQPPTGTQATETYDYEAPFGQLVEYEASGTYLPFLAPDWTESWTSLAAWTGSGWSLGPGSTVTSSTFGAMLTRSASGTIQRVEVTDPSNTGVILWTSADELVVAVATGDASNQITSLSADDYSTVPDTGSYTITLLDGAVTVTAADSSWSLEGTYTGQASKVSIYSYGGQFAETSSFSTTGNADRIAVASGGNIYALDIAAKLVRKFNSSGVLQTSWSTTGVPTDIAVDSTEAVYVTDDTSNLVRKYNSSGTAGITWSTTGTPTGIGISSADAIFVLDYDNDVVRKFTTAGATTTSWAVSDDPTNVGKKLAVTAAGAVYVISDDPDAVEVFNATGTQTAHFTSLGSIHASDSIGVDPTTGAFYIISGSSARGFSSAGVEGTETNISPHIIGGLRVDSAGALYIGDTTAKTIRKFTVNSASVDVIEVTLEVTPVAYYEIATVTLSISEAWLIHPSQPELSVSIDAGAWRDTGLNVDPASSQQNTAQAAVSLHQPVGRTRTVAIAHGNRLAETWPLVLLAPTLADRDDVRAIILDQTPLLLRSPASFNWDLTDGYYSVQDVPFDRLTQNLTTAYRRITLPLIPSDPPVVHVATDRTWSTVVEENETWATVVGKYETWADLILGTS